VGVIVAHDSSLTTLRGRSSHTRPGRTTKPHRFDRGRKTSSASRASKPNTTARGGGSGFRLGQEPGRRFDTCTSPHRRAHDPGARAMGLRGSQFRPRTPSLGLSTRPDGPQRPSSSQSISLGEGVPALRIAPEPSVGSSTWASGRGEARRGSRPRASRRLSVCAPGYRPCLAWLPLFDRPGRFPFHQVGQPPGPRHLCPREQVFHPPGFRSSIMPRRYPDEAE
jgi:hypothetical protein